MAENRPDVEERSRFISMRQIASITDAFDHLPLECDGITNVIHYHLSRANIDHNVFFGTVSNRVSGQDFSPHYWVEVTVDEGTAIIDYRVRYWLGEDGDTPHGVFLKHQFPHMDYEGSEHHIPVLPENVIRLLMSQDTWLGDNYCP